MPTSRKTSASPTTRATRRAAPAEPSNSSSSANPISEVVPKGDRRASLEAVRDRLAMETDDLKWSKHRSECHCVCGMTDPRALVALAKEIRTVVAEIAALPEADGTSKLDDIVASVAKLSEHRRSRTPRRADAAGS